MLNPGDIAIWRTHNIIGVGTVTKVVVEYLPGITLESVNFYDIIAGMRVTSRVTNVVFMMARIVGSMKYWMPVGQ